MQQMIYDGSWTGLLTAIFEVYEYKFKDVTISTNDGSGSLFSAAHMVHSNDEKAKRVAIKLKDKLMAKSFFNVYKSFLSETDGIENLILSYIQFVLSNNTVVESDYSNGSVLAIHNLTKKVHREKHRMEAFVRFQLTKDDLYYALIQPDFNVLPLIAPHFKRRYADQRWLIYDVRRKYGIYYNLNEVEEIEIQFNSGAHDKNSTAEILNEGEEIYQKLWQQYFKSVNIEARKNTKLHIQHMPRRYWKYLVEKQPDSSN